MILEKIIEAANDLFDKFWAVVILLLSVFFLIRLVMKLIGK